MKQWLVWLSLFLAPGAWAHQLAANPQQGGKVPIAYCEAAFANPDAILLLENYEIDFVAAGDVEHKQFILKSVVSQEPIVSLPPGYFKLIYQFRLNANDDTTYCLFRELIR